MIDINQENLIPIRQVPKMLPHRPNGRPIHLSACYRWMEKGVDGTRLEAIRVGGTTYTSREALQRFAEHLSHHRTHSRQTKHGRNITRPVVESCARRAREIFAPRQGSPKSSWTNS